MRILAIDSSGLVATVAVVEEENEISKNIRIGQFRSGGERCNRGG